MRTLLLALCGAALFAAEAPIVIRNAKVITITKGNFNGSIVIKDGKIVEAGENVITPPGATVIDAGGQYVMPGIIDPHSHIAAESINEGSLSVTSMVGIEDVVNPEDIAIYRALAGGVTTVNVLHGSANTIGGKCWVIKTRWGADTKGLFFEGSQPGLKFALGENVKRRGSSPSPIPVVIPGLSTAQPRYPATRMGVEDVLRDSFREAKEYQKAWRDYETKAAKGEPAVPPRRDLKLEPLVEVLEGKRIAHCHAYRSDEILMMLRVADEVGFKVRSFEHVLEGYKVANELKAHGAHASTFSDWWAYKVEAWDAIPYNAALLTRKGVTVSLNSDDAELMRHLNQEAAKTIKYGGLSENEALSLITINPAKLLGIEKRVGSIEPGKDADLVMFDRHPLSNFAKVQRVLVDGVLYFDRDRDVSSRAEREARRKMLLERARQQQLQQKKMMTPSRRPS